MTVTAMLTPSTTSSTGVNGSGTTAAAVTSKINLPPISDILLPPIHHQSQPAPLQAPPPQHGHYLHGQHQQVTPAAPQPPQLRATRSLLPPINANGSRYLPPQHQSYEVSNNYYYGSNIHSHGIITPSHSLNTPPSLATRSPLSSNSSPIYGATNIPNHHQHNHSHGAATTLASPPLRQSQSHHTLYQRQVPPPGYLQVQHQQNIPSALYKTHSSPPMGLNIRNGSIGESSEDDEDEYSNENKHKLSNNGNDGNGKRKTRNNLPKEITYILLKWLNDHLNHPYPNSFEKNQLMMATGLNQQQLSNWFINARRRKIKSLKEQKRISLI